MGKLEDVEALIKKLEEKVEDGFKEVSFQINEVKIDLSSLHDTSTSSLRELKHLLVDSISSNNDNIEEMKEKFSIIQNLLNQNDQHCLKLQYWMKEQPSLEDMKLLMKDLEEKVDKRFDEIQVDMNKMKSSIIDELSGDNLAQYTEMKLIMHQIQSSIPKDRATMEQFISTELSRVMTCVQNQSSKTEIANLQDTLLHQLCAQNNSLEDIRDQLENGFTTINDSLEEVHSKLDALAQSMIDFQLDLSSQLGALKNEEIDLEDIEAFLDELGNTKKKIQKFLGEEVKNKDVKNMIIKSISTINDSLESLEISSE